MDWFTELQAPVQSGIITASVGLLATLSGAGIALLGTRLGRGRRERREDRAAWRDRRHDAYMEAWIATDKLGLQASKVRTILMHMADPEEDRAAYDRAVEELYRQSRAHIAMSDRMMLMASRSIYISLKEVGAASYGLQLACPSSARPWRDIPLERRENFAEHLNTIAKHQAKLSPLMRRELGLPEGE